MDAITHHSSVFKEDLSQQCRPKCNGFLLLAQGIGQGSEKFEETSVPGMTSAEYTYPAVIELISQAMRLWTRLKLPRHRAMLREGQRLGVDRQRATMRILPGLIGQLCALRQRDVVPSGHHHQLSLRQFHDPVHIPDDASIWFIPI